MKISGIIAIISLVTIFTQIVYSGDGFLHFPLNSQTEDDFSSAYGPRYYSDERHYDFHAAIDIAAPENTEVFAICNGKINYIKDSTDPNQDYVIVEHNDDQGTFFVMYMHIDPDPLLQIGQVVDEYTKLGLIDPYSSGSHLDIRYCIESAFNDRVTYKNALNPGAILAGTNYNTTPELVYDDGSQYGSIIENGYSFPIETDENGFFIKIGARVEDDALDFDEIYIIMMKIFYIIHMIYLIHHLYTMDTITMQ